MNLGTCAWTLTAVWPYAPILQKSLETGQCLQGIFSPIPAQVPGCVQMDLLRAGLIPHPYQKMNSLSCEWIENRWWIYEAQFDAPCLPGKRYTLDCAGIDHTCLIYLNDVQAGRGEGMFLPVQVDVTALLKKKGNTLRIVLLDAPKELALGHTSQVTTQKSRFSYHWDFATRLVHLGIWDEISLHESGPARIVDTCLTTDWDGVHGIVRVRAHTDLPCVLDFALYDGNDLLDVQRTDGAPHTFYLANPRLWFAGTGREQALYRVEIRAWYHDVLSDTCSHAVGIRRLRFLPNENAPAQAPPYTIELNGNRCYCKGVNIVPLDQMYGCVDDAHYERFCRNLVRANVNLVRIWGGGLVEKEAFYAWCDRLGILVWQEFIQSSSGVENVPPTTSAFLSLLRKNAEALLRRKRSHTCTTIYCGGNELREYPNADTPATTRNKNLAMLEKLVKRLDPGRLFLPTSAFGPEEYLISGVPGSHYDVHGTWKYEGVHAHYALYNASDALLHSEFGADGMSRPDTIRWILDDPAAKPDTMADNDIWRFHGEWWDTAARDEALFGPTMDLDAAVRRSQLLQAEAVRYPVEGNRRRAFQNSGSIVWQFNEPWPNMSCTSLTEYDGTPKLAYHFLRNAYAPQAATLWYQTICPKAGDSVLCRAVWVGDAPPETAPVIDFSMRDFAGNILLHRQMHDGQSLRFPAPHTADGLYFITLTLTKCGAPIHENTYFFSTVSAEFPLRGLLLSCGPLICTTAEEKTTVRNNGDRVALYISQPECGVFTLFPGEHRVFDGIHTGFAPINP